MLAGLVDDLLDDDAACGYSLYCVQDNPLFFLTWYGVAILIAMAAGAAIGGRLLRW
jgi:hypothetical protein